MNILISLFSREREKNISADIWLRTKQIVLPYREVGATTIINKCRSQCLFLGVKNFVETFAEINLGFRVTPTSVNGFRTESHYIITRMIIFARTYLYIYLYASLYDCETYVKKRPVRKLEKLSARKQTDEKQRSKPLKSHAPTNGFPLFCVVLDSPTN